MNSFDTPVRLSVILVTWNSSAYLAQCLACLAAQAIKDFEIIIVDNGSKDGSIDGLKSRWPGLTLRIEHLDQNLGFAVANNIGSRLARGKGYSAKLSGQAPAAVLGAGSASGKNYLHFCATPAWEMDSPSQ